jgi:hypothetical protein
MFLQEQRSPEPLHAMRGQAAQEPERDEVERRQHAAHGRDVPSREGVWQVRADADQRDQQDQDEPQPQQRVGERGDQDDPDVPVLRGQRLDLRGVVHPRDDRRRGDGDRDPFPDPAEERCEREREADGQHRDEDTPPHDPVEPQFGYGQDVGTQEQPPRDPEDDPGHEGEADVPELVAELIGTERRLERRVTEPKPQPIQA